jgi:hypothetical protein
MFCFFQNLQTHVSNILKFSHKSYVIGELKYFICFLGLCTDCPDLPATPTSLCIDTGCSLALSITFRRSVCMVGIDIDGSAWTLTSIHYEEQI